MVDVDDCIAACAALVEAGRVDVSRIAIRGSSAGGFTVLAALVRSSMFAAGTCIYGIGDLTMLSEETHKFEAHYLDRLIGRLPEAAATYAARSPINHLDALACPVIFFHGTLDKVVPISQARAMAQAMRERGIPYALHEFEGEGHGFRRADTMRRVLELELAFYGEVFGFTSGSAVKPRACQHRGRRLALRNDQDALRFRATERHHAALGTDPEAFGLDDPGLSATADGAQPVLQRTLEVVAPLRHR